jgi:hypothetical protein
MEVAMRERSACVAACLVLSLLFVACSGGGPSGPPAKGADVCDALNKTQRFRYTLTYVLDSPRQENPPADPNVGEPGGEYVLKPSSPGFRLESKHDGTFQQPDRADFQLSTPDQPEQKAVRMIRIGQGQWAYLGDSWQILSNPPAYPWGPPTLCDAFVSPLDLQGVTGALEDVGGTQARHFHLSGAPLSAAGQLLGESSDFGRLLKPFDIDLWVSEKDGRPVKLQAVSRVTYPSGRELSMTLSLDLGSYNDDSIDIKQPI